MLTLFFWLIALAGVFYFGLKTRKVDFFTIAFFSCLVYFMPGFTGYVLEYNTPYSPIAKIPDPIVGEAYWILIIVVCSVIIGAIIYDSISSKSTYVRHFPGLGAVLPILLSFSLIGFVFTIIEIYPVLFSGSKLVLYEEIGRLYNLWVYSAVIGISVSYAKKNWFCFFCFLIFLLLDSILIMNRTFLVFGILSVALLYLHEKGAIRLINYWKVGVLVILFGWLVLCFHHLKGDVIKGDYNIIIDRMSSLDFYTYSVQNSEPWGIQGILNEVVKNDFKVGLQHFTSIIYIPLPFATTLGARPITFNDKFEGALFPYVVGGRASNPWAEMWSAGGWFLLIVFILLFNFLLFLGSKLINIRNPTIKAFVAIVFLIMAFYIHRNGLSTILMFERRIIFIIITCCFLSLLLTQKATFFRRSSIL